MSALLRMPPPPPPSSAVLQWAVVHLTKLLENKPKSAFDAAFEAMFAKDLVVTVIGEKLSRDEYKDLLLGLSAAGVLNVQVKLAIHDKVLGLSHEKHIGKETEQVDTVGIFYTSFALTKFRILRQPAQRKLSSFINLTIKTPKVPHRNTDILPLPLAHLITEVNQVICVDTYKLRPHYLNIPQEKMNAATSGAESVELDLDSLTLYPEEEGNETLFDE